MSMRVICADAGSSRTLSRSFVDSRGDGNANDDSIEDDASESDQSNLFKAGERDEDLAETAYDGVILALACLTDARYVERHGFCMSLLQLVLIGIVHVISVGVQLILIISLLVCVVQQSADDYRHGLGDATALILAALAAEPPVRLAEKDRAMHNCKELETFQHAHTIIIFLWSSKLLGEFADVLHRFFIVMPLCGAREGRSHGIVEDSDTGAISILDFKVVPRIIIILFVCSPQALCAGLLYWTGAKFLFFTSRMDVLIMKAISLSFIAQLDEVLYAAFASLSFKERLKKASYLVDRERPVREWSSWGIVLLKFFVAISMTMFLIYGIFGQATAHRDVCFEYFAAFPSMTPGRGDEPVWTTFLKGLEIK